MEGALVRVRASAPDFATLESSRAPFAQEMVVLTKQEHIHLKWAVHYWIRATLQPWVEADTPLREAQQERVNHLLATTDDAKATIAEDEARRKELLEDV